MTDLHQKIEEWEFVIRFGFKKKEGDDDPQENLEKVELVAVQRIAKLLQVDQEVTLFNIRPKYMGTGYRMNWEEISGKNQHE